MRRSVMLLVLFAAGVGARPAVASPLGGFREAEGPEARLAVVKENPAAFLAAADSALVSANLEDATERALFEEAGRLYFEATRDSLLLSDVAFVRGKGPAERETWYRGVLLHVEGDAHYKAREYQAAADALQEAIALYQKAGHLRREAVAWGALGSSQWGLGNEAEYEACYVKALALRRKVGDLLLIGRALNTLGTIKYEQLEYTSALDYYGQARQVREKLGIPNDLALTLAGIGHVNYKMGNLSAAQAVYEKALEIAGADASPKLVGQARGGLANVYHSLGKYKDAVRVNEELLPLAQAEGPRKVAVLRYNIAAELLALGNPAGALTQLQEARTLQEGDGDLRGLAETLNRMGEAYKSLSDGDRALATWLEAKAVADSSGHEEIRRQASLNLADAYGKMGLTEKAREMSEELLAWSEAAGDSVFRRDVLRDLGFLEDAGRNYSQALVLHREALSLDQALDRPTGILEDRANIGLALTALGRLPEGREELRWVMERAQRLDARDVLENTYLNLGDNFEQARDLDSARVYYSLAIDMKEASRAGALGEATKAASLGGHAVAYEALVHVLAQMGERAKDESYQEEALEVAERGKARALLDRLDEARLDLSPRLTSGMQSREALLRERTQETRYRLRLAEDDPSISPDSLRALRAQLSGLEHSYEDFMDRARFEDPRFATVDPGEVASLEEIRDVLLEGEGRVLLEYALGDSASYLWALSRSGFALYRLPDRAHIEAEVTRLRGALDQDAQSLRGQRVMGAEAWGAGFAEASASLSDMILRPVLADLAGAREVVIVPDGPLHYVPFELLLAARPPAGSTDEQGWRYVLQDLPVHYGPSATSLVRLTEWKEQRGPVTAPRAFLGVGDPVFRAGSAAPLVAAVVPGDAELRAGLAPLPYTRAEVEKIGGLFSESDRMLLLGAEAREKTLEEPDFLSQFRIIHLASHGLVDEQHPERSKLALSFPEDPSEDGYLQASEIYGLKLNADLVVLSACETGKGKMIQGEGALGLSRAFLYAGTPAVVVSLWSVADEATAELMTAFYTEMVVNGRPPAQALALAKASMRAGRFAYPFYWAGFVMVGVG